MTELRLARPRNSSEWGQARALIEEYAASLGVDLCFQDFPNELERLEIEYGPPRGAMILAILGSDPIGCAGLRAFDDTTAEMKRLYVAPRARGRDVGRALAKAIVETAREYRYERVVLDTLPSMSAARALYETMGFKPIDAYRFNPIEGTVFMELHL